MKSGKSIIMSAILIFSIITTTIVYSAFNTELQVKGEAILRSENNIRITSLEKIEYTSGVYETYNNKYTKDTINIYVTLPANSSITYEVTVINKSDKDYIISKIDETSSNTSVTVTNNLKAYNAIIEKNSTEPVKKTFTIEISNNTSITQVEELMIQYKFVDATFANYLLSIQDDSTVLTNDGTTDHNMRYMGKNPNNYITFEGEEWRVLGVFNNIDNGVGKKETRVKIVKTTSIGNKKWNSELANIWQSASLNEELQAMYVSSSMIENAVWHLGDPGGTYSYLASQSYEHEQEGTVASGNDNTWTGKVGLMYPSDYGFASSACQNVIKLSSYTTTNPDCNGTDWLFSGVGEWLISPRYNTSEFARFISASGYIAAGSVVNVTTSNAVRPVVYLKSEVKCTNCNESTAGTQSNPFKIA